MAEKTLTMTWKKSGIGYPRDQRNTIKSLGFTRLNQTIEKPDTPSIRGMVYKVRHLVHVDGEGEILGSSIHAGGSTTDRPRSTSAARGTETDATR
ncbi:MAG: 50S ribosomal protein L30 [Vicinamibacterales bacterium]